MAVIAMTQMTALSDNIVKDNLVTILSFDDTSLPWAELSGQFVFDFRP